MALISMWQIHHNTVKTRAELPERNRGPSASIDKTGKITVRDRAQLDGTGAGFFAVMGQLPLFLSTVERETVGKAVSEVVKTKTVFTDEVNSDEPFTHVKDGKKYRKAKDDETATHREDEKRVSQDGSGDRILPVVESPDSSR